MKHRLLCCNVKQGLLCVRLVGAFRSMNSLERAAVDGMHTADRLNEDLESSVAADAWQREYFSVLPELDDLAR